MFIVRGVRIAYNRAAFGALCVLNAFALSSCVLMRSSEDVGGGMKGTPEELLDRKEELREGMTLLEALQTLKAKPEQLQRMTPEEIGKELYAGVQLQAPFEKRDEIEAFFKSMSGYWVRRTASDRDTSYGWTGSETETTGRAVQFAVVFKDNVLYKVGTDTGAPINERKKEGYLRGLGPSALVDSAKKAVMPN